MEKDYIEQVYETLWFIPDEYSKMPGIKSEFENGSYCMTKYEEVLQANRRICEKLGIDESEDVEIIIDSMIDIQHALCRRMYEIGAERGLNPSSGRNIRVKVRRRRRRGT